MKDTGKGAVFLPHTAGRYAARRFRKAQVMHTWHCCLHGADPEIFGDIGGGGGGDI